MYGGTPLHRAATKGESDILALLLERDSSAVDAADRYGKTALDYAREAGCSECVRILGASRAE
jgi:ankyrin repeat protein